MSEPFWWPIMEPPLPDHEADLENGWPWIEKSPSGIVSFIRLDPHVTAEDLQMDSAEVERITQHERVMAIGRKIAVRDTELLKRLAEND